MFNKRLAERVISQKATSLTMNSTEVIATNSLIFDLSQRIEALSTNQ